MSKSDIAIELFNEGYNCAQAVLLTFDEEIGLDRETAIKVSCEYSAGMAEGGICTLMVSDLKLKQNSIDDKSLKENILTTICPRFFKDSVDIIEMILKNKTT